jgi:hypothetical protein
MLFTCRCTIYNHKSERMSDCCLTPIQQVFSYIKLISIVQWQRFRQVVFYYCILFLQENSSYWLVVKIEVTVPDLQHCHIAPMVIQTLHTNWYYSFKATIPMLALVYTTLTLNSYRKQHLMSTCMYDNYLFIEWMFLFSQNVSILPFLAVFQLYHGDQTWYW